MVRVGIFGATGYTGYELVKLLSGHAEAEIVYATSRGSAGKRLSGKPELTPRSGGIPEGSRQTRPRAAARTL